MLACQKINADDRLTIYGIVATGVVWEFGKLAGNVFTRDLLSYSIAEPARVLGILDFIFAACEREAGA
jgi:CBS domain-containing protein